MEKFPLHSFDDFKAQNTTSLIATLPEQDGDILKKWEQAEKYWSEHRKNVSKLIDSALKSLSNNNKWISFVGAGDCSSYPFPEIVQNKGVEKVFLFDLASGSLLKAQEGIEKLQGSSKKIELRTQDITYSSQYFDQTLQGFILGLLQKYGDAYRDVRSISEDSFQEVVRDFCNYVSFVLGQAAGEKMNDLKRMQFDLTISDLVISQLIYSINEILSNHILPNVCQNFDVSSPDAEISKASYMAKNYFFKGLAPLIIGQHIDVLHAMTRHGGYMVITNDYGVRLSEKFPFCEITEEIKNEFHEKLATYRIFSDPSQRDLIFQEEPPHPAIVNIQDVLLYAFPNMRVEKQDEWMWNTSLYQRQPYQKPFVSGAVEGYLLRK